MFPASLPLFGMKRNSPLLELFEAHLRVEGVSGQPRVINHEDVLHRSIPNFAK